MSVLALGFVAAWAGPATAQQSDPAGLPLVRRALSAMRPDLRLSAFRTLAVGHLAPGRRVAVVAGGQSPRRGEEWFPETWGVVLLDSQLPGRVRVLDTLRASAARASIEFAAPDEVIVRREASDYGENLLGDYRQYFFHPDTWADLGRRVYSGVTAVAPVAVQDSVFVAVQVRPMPGTSTAYPSLLLAVPAKGGTPEVHRHPLDSVYGLEAFGDSLALLSESRVWMRTPGIGRWVGTPALDSIVRERRLADSLHRLHPRLPAFRVRSSASSDTIEEVRLTGTRRIPLPAPSWERFARTRPKPVEWNTLERGEWLLHATVGPSAIVGEQLWFGLKFYDGEGMSGVGGFGVLDPASGRLQVRYPPAMADWSVASLAVEDSVLWLGLASYGEGSTSGGGVARYDIRNGRLSRYDLPGVVTGILPAGSAVYFAGERGLHVLRRGTAGDVLDRLTVRLDRDGAPHVLRIRTPVRVQAPAGPR